MPGSVSGLMEDLYAVFSAKGNYFMLKANTAYNATEGAVTVNPVGAQSLPAGYSIFTSEGTLNPKNIITESFNDNKTCQSVVEARTNTAKSELHYSATYANGGSCSNFGSSGDEAKIRDVLDSATTAASLNPVYTINCDYCSASMKIEKPQH